MTREAKLVGGLLGLVCITILSSATTCTWAVASGASPKWRILFRVMCHGLESRCLILWDTAMPICSRCVAIYGGVIIGILAFASIGLLRSHPPPLSGLIALTLPLALDGISQAIGLRESTNELRVVSGILAGSGFAAWVLGSIEIDARERLKTLKFEMLTPENRSTAEP